jgi:hypothetical protein
MSGGAEKPDTKENIHNTYTAIYPRAYNAPAI